MAHELLRWVWIRYPRGICSWRGLEDLSQWKFTLVGEPDSLRTDRVAVLIAVAVHLAASLDDSLLLSLKGGLVILGEVDDFPISLVDLVAADVLCRARMARESPTLAHVSWRFPSSNSETSVVPLVLALNSFVSKSSPCILE